MLLIESKEFNVAVCAMNWRFNEVSDAQSQALEQAVGRFCIGLCRQPFHLHRYGGPLGL